MQRLRTFKFELRPRVNKDTNCISLSVLADSSMHKTSYRISQNHTAVCIEYLKVCNLPRSASGHKGESWQERESQIRAKPVLDEQRFTLSEVGAAYAHLASGNAIGKIVIDI